jgi:hypothetical protein
MDRRRKARLTETRILAWADAHKARTGRWPRLDSGAVPESPGEDWRRIDRALRRGDRGLPGGSSLARLLGRRRGVRNPMAPPALTEGQILAWADAHRAQTGAWPTSASGPVRGAPGETWWALDKALQSGRRGLPGRDTLFRLLRREGGLPERRGRPRGQTVRLRRVLRLRGQGLTLAEVGRRLGVSRQAVQQMLRRPEAEAGARAQNRSPQRPKK